MQPTTSASAESAARPPRRLSRCFAVAGLALAGVLLAMLSASAQPAGNPAPAANPGSANSGAPAGAAVNPAGAAPAEGSAPVGDAASEQIPEGFAVPKAPPPEFALEKELISADEFAALEKSVGSRQKYLQLFRRADMSAQGIVPDWAKLRLYSMTIKDNRAKLHDLRRILMEDISFAGNLVDRDQQAVRRFREMLFKEVQVRATELLDNQFHVRLQAVLILGNLTLIEADTKNNIREEAYTPPWEPLLQVVVNPDQHQALKIVACNGLRRILLVGTLRSDQSKTQIARGLTAELLNPSSHPWYQMRLCDALGSINLELTLDNERVPLVIDTLSKVAADENRDLCVRAEAAKALGRAPLPAGTSEQVLAWVIADVAYDLAAAYNQDAAVAQRQQAGGALGSRLMQTQLCLYRVYSAFQPDDEDNRLYEGRKPGLLAKRTGDKSIADTFGLTVPVVAHVLKQPEGRFPQQVWNLVPDAQVKALSDWLAGNIPATARVHQELAPLSLNAPGAAAAVDTSVPPGTQPTSTTANR